MKTDSPVASGESADVLAALGELTRVVALEHERAAARERVIDRLHEENQTLRRNEWDTVVEPVRNALFALHASLRQEAGRWADRAGSAEEAARLFDAFARDASEALERLALEPFEVEVGVAFDPVRHKHRRDVPVGDPALDGTVAACTTPGFIKGDRVVRRAEVTLARYRAPEPEPTNSEEEPR